MTLRCDLAPPKLLAPSTSRRESPRSGRAWSVGLIAATLLLGVSPVGASAARLGKTTTVTYAGTTEHRAKPAPSERTPSGRDGQDGDEQTEPSDEESPPPWYERIRFSGDFRARYEGFYQEGPPTRNRGRLRLRLRLDTEINEDARFQMQVASGDPGTPASTNQTLDSFFQPKPFNLDRAYLAYNPRALSAMTLGVGKFPSPVMRTQMTFDDDLNYEGAWEHVTWSPRAGVGIDLAAMQTAVNEVSGGRDAYMLAGYGAVRFDIGAHSLQFSGTNYGWSNTDQIAQAQASRELTSLLTNEVVRDTANNVVGFASRYNVVDIIGEATVATRNPNYPIRILAEYAHNTRAANDRDSGFWIEAAVGDPGAEGSWGATYTHGWIEQDVTLSAFVFSDMPGTNLRLNMLETSYVPKAGLSLDVTLHLTQRLFVPESDPNHLLSRLHVAVVIRF